MRNHRRSFFRNLSSHGVCAVGVFLFSQVVPLVSMSEIQPLMDRIHQLVSPMNAVEKVGVVLIETASSDANEARRPARGQSSRGQSKNRGMVAASGG